MLEAEASFLKDVDELADLVEGCIKAASEEVAEGCREELEALWLVSSAPPSSLSPSTSSSSSSTISRRLNDILSSREFARMTYTEAILALESAHRTWENPVKWGLPLQSEHERYLAETYVGGPVFVTHYPSRIKPFYMREAGDEKMGLEKEDSNAVVECLDLLVPGVGELVGGSLREERLDLLQRRMRAAAASASTSASASGMDIDTEAAMRDLAWYVDLRRFGSVPHGGFGLGFERYLMYLTGMTNIRDATFFPTYYGVSSS